MIRSANPFPSSYLFLIPKIPKRQVHHANHHRQTLFSLHYVLSPIQYTLVIIAFPRLERPLPIPTPATPSWFPPRVLEAV